MEALFRQKNVAAKTAAAGGTGVITNEWITGAALDGAPLHSAFAGLLPLCAEGGHG